MPRIRKRTSNRQSTNDRRKIQRKVRESKKKSKKAAKNNQQWKSKTPKDPGIPNNFPFKDQILAEVSETRRLEAEEKSRRKAEKKALRSGNEAAVVDENVEAMDTEDTQLTGLQVGNDAVGGVAARRLVNAKTLSRPASKSVAEESDEEEDVPILINRELPNLKTVIEQADVVIQILDARDPSSFRSSDLEELVKAKGNAQLLLVLNKIDLCPREAISAWAAQLTKEHQTLPFRSSSAFLPGAVADQKSKSKGKTKAPVGNAWGSDAILGTLRQWAEAKADAQPLTVAVVGAVNAGKSAFVNSVVKRAALTVYALDTSSTAPTTTQLPQEVILNTAGKDIRFIDTPGFSWKVEQESEDRDACRIRDILLRSKGRVDKLKDPVPAVSEIVARSNPEDLILLYKTPAFAKGDTSTFLAGVARSNHLVKKHGELDTVGASRIILRDWSTGGFARYTNALSTNAKPSDSEDSQLAPNVQSVIDRLQPRKELRKTTGLVRLTPGSVDRRRLDIESPWAPIGSGSISSDDEEIEEEEEEDIEEDEDEEDEESSDDDDASDDDDDGEPMESSPPSKNKRKRNDDEIPVISKRVAFNVPSKPKTPKAVPVRKTATPKDSAAKSKSFKQIPGAGSLKAKSAGSKAPKPKSGAGADEAYDFGKFF